jgi:hypothetical protein
MVIFGVVLAVQGELGWWAAPVAGVGIASGTVIGYFSLRNRWGERPDADQQPLPTYRRVWVRVSDRALKWWMWLGLAGAILYLLDLLRGARGVSALIGVVGGVWLFTTTRAERSRRTRT